VRGAAPIEGEVFRGGTDSRDEASGLLCARHKWLKQRDLARQRLARALHLDEETKEAQEIREVFVAKTGLHWQQEVVGYQRNRTARARMDGKIVKRETKFGKDFAATKRQELPGCAATWLPPQYIPQKNRKQPARTP